MVFNNRTGKPKTGDYAIAEAGICGTLFDVSVVDGRYLGRFSELWEVEDFIRRHAGASRRYPSVWMMGKRGGYHLVTDWTFNLT
jgi:hypothetical protein